MSKISSATIDQIRDTRLSTALQSYVSFKPAGKLFKANSPFNSSDKTASFIISDAKGIWKCFSTDKGGTDIISFIMQKDNLDFVPAVLQAAKDLNIQVEYKEETREEKDKREHTEILQVIVEKVNKTYVNNFNRLTDDHWAKKYMLETREFSMDTLELFDIGFAQEGSHLTPIIKNEGLLHDAIEIGIIKEGTQEGNYYDFYRDRITFPIYDHRKKCIAFTARVNPANEEGSKQKYLNSSESKIFNKSKVLYGYNLAKESIPIFGYALLVEGSTDVMRMHQVDFGNAIATLGVALSETHIKELKKVTDKVVLFRDNDKAGFESIDRDLDLLLKNDMLVEVFVHDYFVLDKDDKRAKLDPDSIGKTHGKDSLAYISNNFEDAIIFKIKRKYNDLMKDVLAEQKKEAETYKEINGKEPKAKKVVMPAANKKNFADYIGNLLFKIADKMLQSQYAKDIANRFDDIVLKEINDTIAKIEESKKPKVVFGRNSMADYMLPKEVEDKGFKLENFFEDIVKYGVFQANNKIWIIQGDAAPFHFKYVSNFDFQIIQHMSDEEYPKRLFRMKNIFNKEVISHDDHNKFNSQLGFRDIVTKHGNFQYKATSSQHEEILSYMMDKMGDGEMVEQLGWIASAGFWIWNNEVVIPGEKIVQMDENGVFVHNKKSYYFPSANKVFKKAKGKYVPQKKFITQKASIDFYSLMSKIVTVHKERGMTAILYGISALFQDIISYHTKMFPIYFLYGEGGSGKDNIAEIIQSFVGEPQSVINLAAKSSTLTAQIRKTSQFNNGIVHFSEYKRNADLDELIKQLFDRRGREIGKKESKYATDEIEMSAAVVVTGNEYSEDKPTMSRALFEEISISKHTEQENTAYDELKEIVVHGFSEYSNQFIMDRVRYEKMFLKEYNLNKRHLSSLPEFKDTMSRMIQTIAVLYTTYTIYDGIIKFPFGKLELETHLAKMINNMKNKMAGASPISRFWECFMACMRGNDKDSIMVHHDYKMDGSIIYMKWTQCYNVVLRKWLMTYKETIPGKTDLLEMLKSDTAYYGYKDNCRISRSAKINATSVFMFNIDKMAYIKDDFTSLWEMQYNASVRGTDNSDKTDSEIKAAVLENV